MVTNVLEECGASFFKGKITFISFLGDRESVCIMSLTCQWVGWLVGWLVGHAVSHIVSEKEP